MSAARPWASFVESRRCAGRVRVHPGMRIRRQAGGMLRVEQLLEAGIQWPGIPTYPGHIWCAGTLVARDFRIFTGARIGVNAGATLELGSGYLNVEASIACFDRITIGEGVAIGEQVMIRDSDNHAVREDAAATATAPVEIGSEVWIGSRATILKGVSIGRGAVVAAGAVVIDDVPAGSLVAGVPATVRRTGVAWRAL